jgi:hypothetical protein
MSRTESQSWSLLVLIDSRERHHYREGDHSETTRKTAAARYVRTELTERQRTEGNSDAHASLGEGHASLVVMVPMEKQARINGCMRPAPVGGIVGVRFGTIRLEYGIALSTVLASSHERSH